MLIDISHLTTESESRRAALLADAENYRLARLARRARRRRDTPRGDPPQRDRSEPGGTPRNHEAGRRYAVSR
ncbi:hypothetical protein FHX44_114175 [Pseudonocardia hierapolitana]|uniref:Uncharacterized protein n=1 Tax=Pseudonocardia hierapolitana TaxID=1128676 RepID=A0A561STR5_9PSEU|nr:hypothetical protein [Pseudonocardia hierapolitana]TWF78255.1 hypothetical protein FHX44_114175 [Pseudonocardia hierapolitana]